MNQPALFDNTPPHKLHRSKDPETSKEAASKVLSGKTRKFIYDEVVGAEGRGATLKEICNWHGLQMSSYSSRASELEKASLIFYRGDTRDGCRIMRATEYDNGVRICGKCGGALIGFYNYECQSTRCTK